MMKVQSVINLDHLIYINFKLLILFIFFVINLGMFSIIYSFNIKPDCEEEFITAWKKMTILLYTRENSLGSRLHRVDKTKFVAYAQWPDKETWAKEKVNLPKSALEYQRIMSETCTEIKTEYAMEVVEDLLK
jgi:hypothetical protein